MEGVKAHCPENTMFVKEQLTIRMNTDITTFISQYTNPDDNKVLTDFASECKSKFLATLDPNPKHHITQLYDEIKKIQLSVNPDNPSETVPKYTSYFDTVHNSNDSLIKCKLWILRTYLLYSILHLAHDVISNIDNSYERYYKNATIYSGSGNPEKFTIDYTNNYSNTSNTSNTRNTIIGGQIQFYKIGIFGSMSATSDIDIGLQYCNPDPDSFEPGLAYIIKIIEDLFIIYTGCKSLDFDIELYGNIIFMQDPMKCKDIYYLDTSELHTDKEGYKQLLTMACVSILRNYYADSKTKPHIDPEKIQSKIIEDSENVIHMYYNSINNKNYTIPTDNSITIHTYLDNALTQPVKNIFGDFELVAEVADRDIWKDAIKEFSNYKYGKTGKERTYDAKRALYYTSLLEGDKVRKDVYGMVISKKAAITLQEKIDCILAEATTQAKREESYLLAPTIMHVVRTLQQKESELKQSLPTAKLADEVVKYQTDLVECSAETATGTKPKDAKCNIGKYGYYLSILEQLGYMIRFYNKYCTGDPKSRLDCTGKLKKYGERYADALAVISKLDHTPLPTQGGKKARQRKPCKIVTKRRRVHRRYTRSQK